MPVVRAALFTVLLLAAVVLQTAFFPYFDIDGVTPDVVLIVVVAAALTRGPEFAAVLGFFGGLLIDLAPPAEHVAGRWALALMLVGYLAGKVRPETGRSAVAALVTVGAASFVGTSVFALSGLIMLEPSVSAPEALRVIPIALLLDLLLAPFVLPVALRIFRRVQPRQVAYL